MIWKTYPYNKIIGTWWSDNLYFVNTYNMKKVSVNCFK